MIDIEDPPISPARPRSLYRCRAHPNQSVSWRGKGCPACPQKTTKAARRKARKAELAEPDVAWTQ